jgi:hypothetical protein
VQEGKSNELENDHATRKPTSTSLPLQNAALRENYSGATLPKDRSGLSLREEAAECR